MKPQTYRHVVCIVYDPFIQALVGTKTAQAFDWLYSFLHLASKPTGMVRDGRKWGLFTYKQLAALSDTLPNPYAWQRALAQLEKEGLIISVMDTENNGGKFYAIHFHRVLEVVGQKDFELGYALDMKEQVNRQSKWLEKYVPPVVVKPTPKPKVQAEQNAGQSKQIARRRGHSILLRGSQQIAKSPLYRIDSSSIHQNDITPSNEGDTGVSNAIAKKEVAVEEAKDVFMAITRIACYGLAVSAETRKLVAGAIAKIENTQTANKERILLDVEMIEDYSVWRMLIDWKGKNGFPMIGDFEKEFRYQFLGWYSSEENRKKLALVKEQFPQWRVRLFDGDYVTLREDVQAQIKKPAQGSQPMQNTRQRGARPSPITRRRGAVEVIED